MPSPSRCSGRRWRHPCRPPLPPDCAARCASRSSYAIEAATSWCCAVCTCGLGVERRLQGLLARHGIDRVVGGGRVGGDAAHEQGVVVGGRGRRERDVDLVLSVEHSLLRGLELGVRGGGREDDAHAAVTRGGRGRVAGDGAAVGLRAVQAVLERELGIGERRLGVVERLLEVRRVERREDVTGRDFVADLHRHRLHRAARREPDRRLRDRFEGRHTRELRVDGSLRRDARCGRTARSTRTRRSRSRRRARRRAPSPRPRRRCAAATTAAGRRTAARAARRAGWSDRPLRT